jgi:TetR/AcrR family transcriptional repressor of mexJK operon
MTDEQILALAGELWRQGQGAELTMERLAEVSGISRATLYRRFGSREAILQRLADNPALDVQELSRPDIPTRILQAARSMFTRFGLDGVTMEQIAQEAGVGSATVYRHFGSKEKLIQAFMETIRSPRQLVRSFTVGQHRNLEADLVSLAATILAFIRENQDLIRITTFESPSSESLLKQMRSAQGRTVTMLAEYLAGQMAAGNLREGDPFALALAFVGMVFGFAFVGPNFYERPVEDPASVAQLVTQIFLDGVTQRHAQETQQDMEQRTENHP